MSGSPEQRPLSDGVMDQLRDALLSDAERGEELHSIAKRISHEQSIPRRQAFSLFLDIANRFADDIDKLNDFVTGWDGDEFTCYVVICHLQLTGSGAAARELFDRFFSREAISSLSDGTVRRAHSAAVIIGNTEAAECCFEILFSRSQSSPTAIADTVSALHALAAGGALDEAFEKWGKLLKRCPGNDAVASGYRTFCKKYSRGMPEAGVGVRRGMQAAVPEERRALILQLMKSPETRHECLGYCNEDLSVDPEPQVVDFWVGIANGTANNFKDVPAANKLWNVILTHAPERARNFMAFSAKFNRMGRDHDIDAIIRRAHALLGRHPDASRAFKGSIEIGAERRTVEEWIGRLASALAGDPGECVAIIAALYRYDSRLISRMLPLLEHVARAAPSQFLALVPALADAQPSLHSVVSAVVNRLGKHPVADQILHEVWQRHSHDPIACNMLTSHYIATQQWEKISLVWSEVDVVNATACAHFAAQMLRLGKPDIAASLFKNVARVMPEECIRFGYTYFCSPKAGGIVLSCIEPLLPSGSENSIERHSLLALRLLVRHGGLVRAKIIARKLRENGAITEKDASKIFSVHSMPAKEAKEEKGIVGLRKPKPNATPQKKVEPPRDVLSERDEEIEEYLMQKMPTLKRSSFFREMIDRQPHLKPGKKTSRAARSVVVQPWREKDGDPYSQKKKP